MANRLEQVFDSPITYPFTLRFSLFCFLFLLLLFLLVLYFCLTAFVFSVMLLAGASPIVLYAVCVTCPVRGACGVQRHTEPGGWVNALEQDVAGHPELQRGTQATKCNAR